MKQGWIEAALVGIAFALGIGFVLVLPRMKALRAALPENDGPLSEKGRALVQDPMIVTLIRVRAILAFGIVYLMTAKTESLATSLFILLGSVVVGMLCAATSWSARASDKG
jgi:uncharacterized membrane protein